MSATAASPRRCHPAAELARYVDGAFDAGEAVELAGHIESCARCRTKVSELRAIAGDLARDPVTDLPDLGPLVLARAALPPRRRGWLRPVATALSLCAALAAGIMVEQRRVAAKDDARFQARGGGENPDRWVAIHPFAIGPGAPRALTAGDRFTNEPLAFAYDNGGPDPYRYLALYGIDSAGALLWYFPDDRPGATSIPIEPGAGRSLGDEVRFSPAPGLLRLHAVFSQRPLSTGEIARAARSSAAGQRLPIADTGQHEVGVKVAGGGQ